MNVHENGVELFGFYTKQELNCFKMLTSVSGVGPKASLSILSDFTPEQFAMIVASGDSKMLTKTKGIGAKTAQRIVLELKDKVTSDVSDTSLAGNIGANIPVQTTALSEALEGLMVLGYTQTEVMPILAKLDQTLNTAELIRETLRIIGSNK